MLGHLLFFILFYFYLSHSIISKLFLIILLYEFFFLDLIIDVIERSEESYLRDDWFDDVVEDFLDSFEDDSLYDLDMFLL